MSAIMLNEGENDRIENLCRLYQVILAIEN